MNHVCAIDLGNRTARLVVLDEHNQAGLVFSIPVAAWVLPDGKVVVGDEAAAAWPDHEDRVARNFVRRLGDESFRFVGCPAHELAAEVLAALKEMAERATGNLLTDAVLVVPESLTQQGVQALEQAVQAAGMLVMQRVPASAAILAGCLNPQSPGTPSTVLVCDMGSSATRLYMVDVKDGRVTTRAAETHGDLGGFAWAQRLAERAEMLLQQSGNGPPPSDRETRRRLEWCQARHAELAHRDGVLLPDGTNTRFTRHDYLEATRELTPLLEHACRQFVDKVGASDELNLVVGAGGLADLPAFTVAIQQATGLPPLVPPAPDEAAVRGAAILARKSAIQGGREAPPPIDLAPARGESPEDPKEATDLCLELGEDFKLAPSEDGGVADSDDTALGAEVLDHIDEGTGLMGLEDTAMGEQPPKPWLDENVQFTVYRPARIAPETWCPLLAFAHLAEKAAPDRPGYDPRQVDPVQEVQDQARRNLGDRVDQYKDVTQDSRQAIPYQGELTFVPEAPGVRFNPPSRTFTWEETVHREEFRMKAEADLDGKTARGSLRVYLGAIIVAEVTLSIPVSSQAAPAETAKPDTAESARAYRKIFASYSHRDVAVVEQFEALARAMGDRYLRDCVDLRAGEVWDLRLEQMIRDANVFQLFWSSNSMRSPFVRKEWEYALTLERSNFIRPTYWEDPLPESPPENLPPSSLRALHFQQIRVARPTTSSHAPLPLGEDSIRETADPLSEPCEMEAVPACAAPSFDLGAMARSEAPYMPTRFHLFFRRRRRWRLGRVAATLAVLAGLTTLAVRLGAIALGVLAVLVVLALCWGLRRIRF